MFGMKAEKLRKTTTCQCWNCGKRVLVPNDRPLPSEQQIFCKPCRHACGIADEEN